MSLYINSLKKGQELNSFNFARRSNIVYSEVVSKSQFQKLKNENLHVIENNQNHIFYKVKEFHSFNTVELGSDYYHTGEVVSLLLFYQLIHGSGCECPSISLKIGKESFDRIVNPKV